MLPDRVSNPGPLTYESGALPIALRDPATVEGVSHLIYNLPAGRRGGGGGRNYGTTFRRILCPLAVPYSIWLEYRRPKRSKLRELYDYCRIYPKMEHLICRRNDKPCRLSLQSDLDLPCLLKPVSANI